MNSIDSKIKLKTYVDIKKLDKSIKYGDKIMSIGSCFTDNIGKYLYSLGYDICVNPFGNQYNPLSIAKIIDIILEKDGFSDNDLFYHNGLYNSFYHHSRFSHVDRFEMLKNINSSLTLAKKTFESLDFLMLTWGTAYTYRLQDTEEVVSNCHKLPEKVFSRNLESVDYLFEVWDLLLSKIISNNKDIRIITTISPIRHLRDTAHGNNISKSTLMLFDDLLRRKYKDNMYYFDAYELLLDELRDYRFFDRDLCHPSELAIDIVRERFTDTVLSEIESDIRQAVLKLSRQLRHIPMNVDALSLELMTEQLNLQKRMFSEKYPNVKIQNI